MMAIGRPGVLKLSVPSGPTTDSFSPRMLTVCSSAGIVTVIDSEPVGRYRLDAAGTGAAGHAVDQIGGGAELVLHHGPRQQRVVGVRTPIVAV